MNRQGKRQVQQHPILKNKRSSKDAKTAAASALTQVPDKVKDKKKK